MYLCRLYIRWAEEAAHSGSTPDDRQESRGGRGETTKEDAARHPLGILLREFVVRVPGSSFTVFEAEGSLDGFRHGKLVLSGFASSFVQRVELAVNVAGAPGGFSFS